MYVLFGRVLKWLGKKGSKDCGQKPGSVAGGWTRPPVVATHGKLLWRIIECSLQCSCLIVFMWTFFVDQSSTSVFILKCQGFNKVFKEIGAPCQTPFSNLLAEITTEILGSKTPPFGFHFANIYKLDLGSTMGDKGV